LRPEQEQIGERCLLFLDTDLEYRWPPFRELPAPLNLFSFSIFLEVCAVCLSCYTSLMYLSIGLFVVGTLGLLFSWLYQGWTHKRYLESFWLAGDKGAWPFLKRQEYESALGEEQAGQALRLEGENLGER